MSPIAHDAPTPNPEAAPTLEEVWRVVADQRREIKRLTQRLSALENQDIITTINQHDDRLDTADERLDGHDGRLAHLDAVTKNTDTWMSGIKFSVDETNALVRQLLARLP